MSDSTTAQENIGTIVQVIGPVVDVDFSGSGKMPHLLEALEIQFEVNGQATRLEHFLSYAGAGPDPAWLFEAHKFGYDGIQSERWDAFNVGQNCGEFAGQTVMYPHVHMIPRRKGDMEDPRGGVRHVIPEKGNYKK